MSRAGRPPSPRRSPAETRAPRRSRRCRTGCSPAPPALAAVPADWLAATPGRLLVADHLAVVPADPGRGDRELVALCGSDRYAGAAVAGGAAAGWGDFRLHRGGLVGGPTEDPRASER